MDNLDKCTSEARKAGLTYGQYMALFRSYPVNKAAQPETPKKNWTPKTKIGLLYCIQCGNLIEGAKSRQRKYCCDACKKAAKATRLGTNVSKEA